MKDIVEVRNRSRQGEILLTARWCRSVQCRLRGLTFRRQLPNGLGLLLVKARENRIESAIHMWAVFFPLGVVWMDTLGRVVDLRLALPWRVYLPRAPARYVLEGPAAMLGSLALGDVLEFEDEGL